MDIFFCFFPVLLFLVFLYLLDSFRLVRSGTLVICIAWGIVCGIGGYFLNTGLAAWFHLDFNILSRYVAPATEELLKAGILFYLVSKKKAGFMIDAAIYGFATGAGFSLTENIWYLINTTAADYNLLTWILRGCGTAVMHGGCTALLAIVFIGGVNRPGGRLTAFLPGLLLAFILHSGFNHFPLSPMIQTLMILILLPAVLALVFRFSASRLQQWLEIEFSSEVELLGMIRKGQLSDTRAGSYLLSVKDRFDPETIVDLYCYLGLYLELSILAKRNLMLKENGFPVVQESGLGDKLTELARLRKLIGPVGEFALAPLVKMNYRNLWKLGQLKPG